MQKKRIGIIGASGYGGGELARLLIHHPHVEIALVTAHRQAGQRIDAIHPNLRGFCNLVCEEMTPTKAWESLDLLFLALPHGQSPRLVPQLPSTLPLIDLAGDYRLRDAALYARYYGEEHPSHDLQSGFVYGLAELQREAIRKASRIANPGCFATAILLGLAPPIQAGITTGRVIVDAKTGSSGSGAQPKATTHHPMRDASFWAYKSFAHQHVPEIQQLLTDLRPDWTEKLVFQAHSAPMTRGIFASCYLQLNKPHTPEEIRSIFEAAYQGSPFIRLVEESPNVLWVRGSNFTDISWAIQDDLLLVFVALDNLIKGASGQAIQNMNLMFGFPEETGLFHASSCVG